MSFDISPTGIWLCRDTSPHSFDQPLADGIKRHLSVNCCESVIDLGCGSGAYVRHLHKSGIQSRGYDGNPRTHEFDSLCDVADLTIPMSVIPADAVISLETAEHIPTEHERMFLNNVNRLANRHLILSWFPRDGEGIGHVNPRPNNYVINRLNGLGFAHDSDGSLKLRSFSTLWWFKESLMVFKRI